MSRDDRLLRLEPRPPSLRCVSARPVDRRIRIRSDPGDGSSSNGPCSRARPCELATNIAAKASNEHGSQGLLGRIARSFCVLSLIAASASAQDADVNVFARDGFYISGSAVFANPRFRDTVKTQLDHYIELHPLATDSVSLDWGVGFNARAGYRFHPHFAAELQYEWIDNQGFPVFAYVAENSTLENVHESEFQIRRPEWVVTGNSKLFITKGRAQPFLVMGAGVIHATRRVTGPLEATGLNSAGGTDENGDPLPDIQCPAQCAIDIPSLTTGGTFTEFVMRFGGGLDLYITENLVWNGTVDFVFPFGELKDELDYVSFSTGLTYRFGSVE